MSSTVFLTQIKSGYGLIISKIAPGLVTLVTFYLISPLQAFFYEFGTF